MTAGRVVLRCTICERKFETYRSLLEYGRSLCCSTECLLKYRKRRILETVKERVPQTPSKWEQVWAWVLALLGISQK